jgi:peptide/nickel transport system substrate-binding protein
LLAAATTERDVDKRKKLYADFQRQVMQDLPLIPTHVWAQGYAARKDLTDVPVSIWAPMVPFDTIGRRR